MKNLLYYIFVALYALAANLAHPITPTLIQNLAMPDYMFGLMFAGMSITNFLFSPFWGKLADYLQSRSILLVCCIGYGLGQLFFWQATYSPHHYGSPLFFRLFCGRYQRRYADLPGECVRREGSQSQLDTSCHHYNCSFYFRLFHWRLGRRVFIGSFFHSSGHSIDPLWFGFWSALQERSSKLSFPAASLAGCEGRHSIFSFYCRQAIYDTNFRPAVWHRPAFHVRLHRL